VAELEGVRPLAPEAPLAAALRRGREGFNARAAAALRQGRRVDPAALLAHLAAAVAPVVAAVEKVDPARVDAVAQALFELSLDLVGRDVLGPTSRHPRAVEAWRDLFPKLAARLADDPLRVAGALTNAACNLGVEPGARAGEWLAALGEAGPRCASCDELLGLGQVLAWRSGMAHYRASALEVWETLPEPLAREALGLARGADLSRESLRMHLADPFRRPGSPEVPARLAVVATIGGFRGFGGPFLTPPRAFVLDGQVWAADAERAFTLHADCFGQTLQRSAHVPADDRHMGDASVEADGAVSWAGLTAELGALQGAGGFAASATVLAVTLPRSHHIRVVAKVGGHP
jgi:hypothetical protein